MSMFTPNPIYRSITFDPEELEVIRIACAAVATRDQAATEKAVAASLEEYESLIRKLNGTVVAGSLAALFKPGQEILIEREDLEPVAAVLREHRNSAGKEHLAALDRAIARIERTIN